MSRVLCHALCGLLCAERTISCLLVRRGSIRSTCSATSAPTFFSVYLATGSGSSGIATRQPARRCTRALRWLEPLRSQASADGLSDDLVTS